MNLPALFGVTHLGFFCLVVLLLNATPGPDTAYILDRSLAQGRQVGIVSAAGISAGCCLHTVASVLGLSALLSASATAFLIVKLLGGGYLIYRGLCLLLRERGEVASKVPTQTDKPIETTKFQSLPIIFLQAFLTNVTNPKVLLFFVSFFPQFVIPDTSHKTLAFLLLGVILVVMSSCWNCGMAMVAGMLVRHRRSDRAFQKWLKRIVGGAYVTPGVRLVRAEL